MMRTTSNRELARQLGVSETAVRRAERTGRIRREADGAWDIARVRAQWSNNTDQAQQRREPAPEGDIVVPVDPRYLGLWLTGLFDDPATTDDLDGSWDHISASAALSGKHRIKKVPEPVTM